MSKVGNEYYGVYFNEVHKRTRFFKFIGNDTILKVGINTDDAYHHGSMLRSGSKLKGDELIFCDKSKCHLFLKYYGINALHVAFIEIPDDAMVYVFNDCFRTSKAKITEIVPFENVEDEFWISLIKNNGFVDSQESTKAFEKSKLFSNGFVDSQKSTNGKLLKYVKEQTYELCKLAVEQDPEAFMFVKEEFITDELCELVLSKKGKMLQCFKHKNMITEELYKLAVKQNGLALEFVKEEHQTYEMCKLAVEQNAWALQYVKNQTDELCKLAVQKDGSTLQFVKNQTEEICILAVKNHHFANPHHYARNYVMMYVNDQYKDAARDSLPVCTLF